MTRVKALNRHRSYDARPLPDDGGGVLVCRVCQSEFVGKAQWANIWHHWKTEHHNVMISLPRDQFFVTPDILEAARHLWRAKMIS